MVKKAAKKKAVTKPLSSMVDAVQCKTCKTLHDIEAETFVVVKGDICVGMNGGIVGSNFNKSGKLGSISIYCRKLECILLFVRKMVASEQVHDLNLVAGGTKEDDGICDDCGIVCDGDCDEG